MKTATKAKESLQLVYEKSRKHKSVYDHIKNRQTDELVVAFCGPLGSGTSTVAKEFEKIIKKYKYETTYLKASDQIFKNISLVGSVEQLKTKCEADRIREYQTAGNALREKYGNDILSLFLIGDIAIKRQEQKNNPEDETFKSPITPEPRRHVTIIDSLKHPDEVKLFKTVYGNMFYLFAILCPEKIREERLNKKKIPIAQGVSLMERDKSETEGFGQKLLDTLQYADFFIRNDEINVTLLKNKVDKYIKLILGDSFTTPTIDEYGMYCAQSAALKSSCLSRQVGAAIISSEGVLISTGCNDVPKCGGGYYSSSDGGSDGRCMSIFGNECANEKNKKIILDDISAILSDHINDPVKQEILNDISKQERLKNLLEFSRSVHAEMDAIINIARLGNASSKGATLYCTTFPCHNCARHIIASGITKVYYIEPYEKSMALKLHDDAIDFDPQRDKASPKKVIFIPFEGVAPRQYMNLFMAGERKSEGKKVEQNLEESKPRVFQYLDSHIDYEVKVVKHLNEIKEVKEI